MSTDVARYRRGLVLPLAGLVVVALVALLLAFENTWNPTSHTMVTQGTAGDYRWALILDRPSWFGAPCLRVRSQGADLGGACGRELGSDDDGGEPQVAFMTSAATWVVYGTVPSSIDTVKLELREGAGPVRTLTLTASLADGLRPRVYAGTVPANADSGGQSSVVKATITPGR
jgi:hypothetical protein